MDKLFFFVTNSQAWKDTREFHENFFLAHSAFMYGFLVAIIVALVLALVFYLDVATSAMTTQWQIPEYGRDFCS